MSPATITISDLLGAEPPTVRTVKPRDTIADTVDMLAEYGIGAVVVTTDGRVINGIISERDVVRNLSRELEGTLRIPVEDLMTRNVSTCRPTDEIDAVMATMIAGRFRHMPVIDEHNALFAIVSLGDLADARLGALANENQQLRQMSGT